MSTGEKFSRKIGVKNLNWTMVDKNDEKIYVKILSRKIDEKMGTGEKILTKKLG